MIPAKTIGQSKGKVILQSDSGQELQVTTPENFSPGRNVWFASRPEKLNISRKKLAKALNAMEGEVWDIAYLGGVTVYKVKLDSGNFIKTAVLNSSVSGTDMITWEDRVWVSCSPQGARVLTS